MNVLRVSVNFSYVTPVMWRPNQHHCSCFAIWPIPQNYEAKWKIEINNFYFSHKFLPGNCFCTMGVRRQMTRLHVFYGTTFFILKFNLARARKISRCDKHFWQSGSGKNGYQWMWVFCKYYNCGYFALRSLYKLVFLPWRRNWKNKFWGHRNVSPPWKNELEDRK